MYSDKEDDAENELNENHIPKQEILQENMNIVTENVKINQVKIIASHELEQNSRINPHEVDANILNENPSNDIILEGFLIYRFTNDQVELEGTWFMSNDQGKERLSYLFLKPNEYIKCEINPEDVEGTDEKSKSSHIKICSSNLFECIIINKYQVFNSVLNYLCGDYSGYFMYYGKTIEDKVSLNFSLEDSLVRINGYKLINIGEGTNNLGHFSIIGYMNFYKSKDEILEKNDLDSDFIKLSEFKLTKIYTAFNPNENYRVIKSYQHRRKRINDEDF